MTACENPKCIEARKNDSNGLQRLGLCSACLFVRVHAIMSRRGKPATTVIPWTTPN